MGVFLREDLSGSLVRGRPFDDLPEERRLKLPSVPDFTGYGTAGSL